MKNFIILLLMLSCLLPALSQNMGIGTISPNAKLEIVGAGSNSATNAFMIKNLVNDTLFRLRNDGRISLGFNGSNLGRILNIAGNGMNFYSSGQVFGGAIFPTDTSVIVWSETGIDDCVILQPNWGKVGIGTHSPMAKMDIKGSFVLGNGGTVLNQIIKITRVINVPSVAAFDSQTVTVTVDGAIPGATVMVSPETALTNGIIIAFVLVSAADTVQIRFTNVSTAAINLAAMDYYITVIQ